MLSNQEKKQLRSLGHDEPVLVYIGKHGLTDTLLDSFAISLESHNLVKVGLQKHATVSVEEVIEVLVGEFDAELVHKVGRVLYFYKYHEDGRIKL